MLKRILALIISSIIFALSLSIFSYIPEEQREPDIYYMGILESFMFIVYVLLIFYTVIGIPVSWLIDKWRKRYSDSSVFKRYIIGIALYSLGGILGGAIYYNTGGSIQFFLDIFLETIAYWLVASILLFNILWVLERKKIKNKSFKKEDPRTR